MAAGGPSPRNSVDGPPTMPRPVSVYVIHRASNIPNTRRIWESIALLSRAPFQNLAHYTRKLTEPSQRMDIGPDLHNAENRDCELHVCTEQTSTWNEVIYRGSLWQIEQGTLAPLIFAQAIRRADAALRGWRREQRPSCSSLTQSW